jgi:hypothetical protein
MFLISLFAFSCCLLSCSWRFFILLIRYSRAYDMSLSVTKWGQSCGDGADKQEEVKRQKRCDAELCLLLSFLLTFIFRELMRAAREAAREASAAAAAAEAASVAAAAAEAAVDNSGATGSIKTEGIKGRSAQLGGDGLGRDDRKRKRDSTGSTGMRAEGGGGQAKKEDACVGVGTVDAGSDEDVRVGARDASSNLSHQRAGGIVEDADVRFADLSEEKAAALDAQVTTS